MNSNWINSIWPPDIIGQIICVLVAILLVSSIIILVICRRYRKNWTNDVLFFLQDSFAKKFAGVVREGKGPDSSTSDISQLDWWIRDIPSFKVDDSNSLNTFIAAKADKYKLSSDYLMALNFLTEICSVYPMLGILGTVIGVSSSIGKPEILMESFSTAVITTIWGIIAGIIHTFILSLNYSYLHELDDIPSRIESSIYDLKQNTNRK